MKLKLKIIDLLARNQEKNFTINEIAKTLKEHYSFVHRIVNELAEDKVIIKTKIGKAYICSLDFKNEKTTALIQLGEIEKRDEFYSANKELRLILEDFAKSTQDNALTIVLFGSYAKGSATKESDIDILVIRTGKIEIDKITKEVYAKYGKEINPILLTQEEFKKQNNKAIIKEIINSHYVLYNVERFVSLTLIN